MTAAHSLVLLGFLATGEGFNGPALRAPRMGSAASRVALPAQLILANDVRKDADDDVRKESLTRELSLLSTLFAGSFVGNVELSSDEALAPPTDSTPAPFVGDGVLSAMPLSEPLAEEDVGELWQWQLALLGITACWGCNFATTKFAIDALGDPADGALFVAARFVLGAAVLLPFVFSVSSRSALLAGARVGGLCALGYAAQAVALGMGSSPGTAAFICSLQSVVVALMASGSVAKHTWLAIGLSVCGVAALELPSVFEATSAAADAAAASPFALGDLVAFGQPIGFGLSYVVLEDAMAEHPNDELPLAALQCAVIGAAAVAATSLGAHALPWDLPWEHMLPGAAPNGPAWGVPLAVLYTALISTSLTIWLTAKVFKRVPSTDASIILASEPLWATACAMLLLGATVGPSDAAGGALILSALAMNQGLFNDALPEAWRAPEESQ